MYKTMNITLLLWMIFIFIFIPTYIQSSHIWSNGFHPFYEADPFYDGINYRSYDRNFTEHNTNTDNIFSMIYKSGVCPLGSFSFYGLTFLLFLYLLILSSVPYTTWLKIRKKTFISFISIWCVSIFLMLIMNLPFFIRSIPAITTGFIIIIIPYLY